MTETAEPKAVADPEPQVTADLPLSALLVQLISLVAALIRGELALAKIELSRQLRLVAFLAGIGCVALLLLFVGLIEAAGALAYLYIYIGVATGWAHLMAALSFFILAAVLGLFAYKVIHTRRPARSPLAENLQADREAVFPPVMDVRDV